VHDRQGGGDLDQIHQQGHAQDRVRLTGTGDTETAVITNRNKEILTTYFDRNGDFVRGPLAVA
jgi:hypothetical protein